MIIKIINYSQGKVISDGENKNLIVELHQKWVRNEWVREGKEVWPPYTGEEWEVNLINIGPKHIAIPIVLRKASYTYNIRYTKFIQQWKFQ